MEYVFTKRQLDLLMEDNTSTEITVGSDNKSGNLNTLQSDLNNAMSKNPGKHNFGADSENYNNNTNDNDGQLDLTVTGQNAKQMVDKVKDEVNSSGNNPYKRAYMNGKLRIHGYKENTNENRIFTKKQFDRFLKSLK